MPSDSPPSKGPRRAVRVGKYEVVSHIASGGMGAVYRARDPENDREVALKVLSAEMAARPAMVERFRREFRSVLKLQHENIVTVYEFDDRHAPPFLVMEFVDGVDLHEYVKKKGPLDPEEARQIVLQGCRALYHAHERGLIHRDIKPSNFLLVQKKGKPFIKLTDFGLAREASADEFRVTRAGTTVGTLDYMAPEQARDSWSADIRSDLFSLGTTWYHLLAGHAPFPEGGLAERLYKIMNEDPPDIREINPRVSDETWEVLERLLAKDPDDRYQTPAELIADLHALLGRSEARPKEERGKKKKTKERPLSIPTPTPEEEDETGSPRWLWPAIWAGVAALLLVGGLIGFRSFRKSRPPVEDLGQVNPPPGPVNPPPPPPPTPPITPPGKGKEGKKEPQPPPPSRPTWPVLYKPARPLDLAALRKEFRGFPESAPAGDSLVRIVRRLPAKGEFAGLEPACRDLPEGKSLVLEIRDNGPLQAGTLALEGRDLTIRAGKGFRPLLLIDVPPVLAARKGAAPFSKKDPKGQPGPALVFFHLTGGRLTLEGIDLAVRWPDGTNEPATLFQVDSGSPGSGGRFTPAAIVARDCTFSVGGLNRAGITLARLTVRKEEEKPKKAHRAPSVHFSRCHARGRSLAFLDLDGAGAEALIENCLVVGGEQPLLRVKTDDRQGSGIRVVRSTLVGTSTLLDLHSSEADHPTPALRWLGWDVLVSRYGLSSGGELVRLADADPERISWRAVNCLYAGWGKLLGGRRTVDGSNEAEWQRLWRLYEGEKFLSAPWPEQELEDPATLAAAGFLPAASLAFQPMNPPEDAPLGCDVKGIPTGRDSWLALAYEAPVNLVEGLGEGVPEIPAPGDNLFHGARVDLNEHDLGQYLRGIQERKKLGPRVVLILSGKGDRSTTPIQIKGSTLVLYADGPSRTEKGEMPLRLVFTSRGLAAGGALIDVEGGGLDLSNLHLHIPEKSPVRAAHLVRVRGGHLRLSHCRLEGPQVDVPGDFLSLIRFHGSGMVAPESAWGCSVEDSTLVSGRDGLCLEGVGSRLMMRQSVLVGGDAAVVIRPGAECKARASIGCSLEQVTVAARRAILRLADLPGGQQPGPVVSEPVAFQTRECVFLNPFPGSQLSRLLQVEGEALSRGLLVWQSEKDTVDRRVNPVATVGPALPERRGELADWRRLWGSHGVRQPRLELGPPYRFFEAKKWPLSQLAVPAYAGGADLQRLGLLKRPR